LIERLKDVIRRPDFAAAVESLNPDDAEGILVAVMRTCWREGAEAERAACLTIAVNTKENYHNLKREHGEHAAFIIENLIRSRTDRENAKTEARKEGETTRMLITQAEFDQAMDTAVKIERAACAKVADDEYVDNGNWRTGPNCARIIRDKICARSEQSE
jgi:hypothetical protein